MKFILYDTEVRKAIVKYLLEKFDMKIKEEDIKFITHAYGKNIDAEVIISE